MGDWVRSGEPYGPGPMDKEDWFLVFDVPDPEPTPPTPTKVWVDPDVVRTTGLRPIGKRTVTPFEEEANEAVRHALADRTVFFWDNKFASVTSPDGPTVVVSIVPDATSANLDTFIDVHPRAKPGVTPGPGRRFRVVVYDEGGI